MNIRKPAQPVYIGIGTSSIILVFVILCMTAFGVMSLISASNSEHIMLKNTEYICDYYNAASEAYSFIASKADERVPGSYETSAEINGEMSLEVAFEVDASGGIIINRFCSISDYGEGFVDFE